MIVWWNDGIKFHFFCEITVIKEALLVRACVVHKKFITLLPKVCMCLFLCYEQTPKCNLLCRKAVYTLIFQVLSLCNLYLLDMLKISVNLHIMWGVKYRCLWWISSLKPYLNYSLVGLVWGSTNTCIDVQSKLDEGNGPNTMINKNQQAWDLFKLHSWLQCTGLQNREFLTTFLV